MQKDEGRSKICYCIPVGICQFRRLFCDCLPKKGLHWDFYLIAQMKTESQMENCFESEKNVYPSGCQRVGK